MTVEATVSARYAEGAKAREEALCCPVDYDRSLLEILPQEIIERDYGCGDPSRYVRPGDTVLDLGSGGGKICYMAAQLVGKGGRVIGVDMTDDMLDLARRHQATIADTLGEDRVTFHKGYIQDLALDLGALEARLAEMPVQSASDLQVLEAWRAKQRQERPMIASDSVDLVISNCVLNLVNEADRRQMIAEIFRVLRPGGRVAISDIVADEVVPQSLKDDATLWSGCISGAFHEQAFLDAFVEAGFVGVGYDAWQSEPWQVVENIEFRSVTLIASKPPAGANRDCGHAVLYRGPWAAVEFEGGLRLPRGQRTAVGEQTYAALMASECGSGLVGMPAADGFVVSDACCSQGKPRAAAIGKGVVQQGGDSGAGCC